MKRIENITEFEDIDSYYGISKMMDEIKEFEDIDTYYGISDIVAAVFKDRVEAHKHLVTANKKIERLNNIINELEKYLEKTIIDDETRGSMRFCYRQIYDYLQELKGSDKE